MVMMELSGEVRERVELAYGVTKTFTSSYLILTYYYYELTSKISYY
jgi:hypothetical protein